jgi:hypothetical protein
MDHALQKPLSDPDENTNFTRLSHALRVLRLINSWAILLLAEVL